MSTSKKCSKICKSEKETVYRLRKDERSYRWIAEKLGLSVYRVKKNLRHTPQISWWYESQSLKKDYWSSDCCLFFFSCSSTSFCSLSCLGVKGQSLSPRSNSKTPPAPKWLVSDCDGLTLSLYTWRLGLSIENFSKSGGVNEENILWDQFSILYTLNPFSIFLTNR